MHHPSPNSPIDEGIRHRRPTPSDSKSPPLSPQISLTSPPMITVEGTSSEQYDSTQYKPRMTRSASVSSVNSRSSSVSRISTSKHRLRPKHSFTSTTFTKPTYCDLCSQFIWGMYKQGEQCVGCGYNVHRKCAFMVKTPCNAYKLLNEPVAESTNIMAEIMVQASKESKKSETIMEDFNPPLSVGTLLKNNHRFVARQGPLIWLNETVLSLLTWQNPMTTLTFLMGYIFFCLYPVLIAILPHGLVLYLIVTSYHRHAEAIANKKPLQPPPPLGTPPTINLTPSQMKENMQSIQNATGILSDLYDAGYTFYKMLDWTYPEKTNDILKLTLISILPTLIVVYLIPINYILLVGGVGVFLSNTALVKAASMTLTPILMRKVRKRIDFVRDAVSEARKLQKGGDIVVVVSVFENQRWWAGMGFVPFLLRTERGQWTDETGTLNLPPKDLYELPSLSETMTEAEATSLFGSNVSDKVWEWLDSDWSLDMAWASTDHMGWVYYDQFWQNGKPYAAMLSVTRRRKWVRKMKLSMK